MVEKEKLKAMLAQAKDGGAEALISAIGGELGDEVMSGLESAEKFEREVKNALYHLNLRLKTLQESVDKLVARKY